MRARRVGLFVVGPALVLVLASACRDEPPTSPPHDAAARLGATRQPLIAQDQYYDGADLPDKTLILTFDDGPSPLAVASDLSGWLKNRPSPIHATFFLNGGCIAATQLPDESCEGELTPNPFAVIAQELADGHVIGNHTTTHRDLLTLDAAEIVADVTETDNELAPYMPWNRQFFRAPFGNYDSDVYDALVGSPMGKYVGPIYWTIGGGPTNATRAADWECWQLGYTTRQCGDLYLNEIHAFRRGVVLMHDRYGNVTNHDLDAGIGNSVDMVKYVVPILEGEGYAFKALWEDPQVAAALPTCNAACATCSGPNANQCTTCPSGNFLAGGTCTACTVCGAGTYTQTGCTATANAVCASCTSCAAGTYASTTCSAAADAVCTACDASCTTCSGGGPSACLACPTGKYLPGPPGACASCTSCGAGQYRATACTASTDTVCSTCDPSCSACSGPAKEQCGTCQRGFFLADNTCKACTVCNAGMFVATACTATADAVCTACAPGSASSDAGASSCDACPPGTFAGTAGKIGCTACGTCDDGNACTDDSCSPTTGCVHAAKLGCGPNSPPPGPSSSSPAPSDPPNANTDAGGDAGVDDSTSSCAMSPRPSPRGAGVASAVLFSLALIASRRRRRRRFRAAAFGDRGAGGKN